MYYFPKMGSHPSRWENSPEGSRMRTGTGRSGQPWQGEPKSHPVHGAPWLCLVGGCPWEAAGAPGTCSRQLVLPSPSPLRP